LLTTLVDSFAARSIETVFEGIEESWQLELAEKSGAAMLQGFVLARPQIMPGQFAAQAVAPEGHEAMIAPLPGPVVQSKKARKSFGRRAH
jgi:EAL domain-containing protein (putative c-di-GMP-specific phosphodiesterase class I)